MITAQRQPYLFQQEWTGRGERGYRDFLLIPAIFFGAVSPGLFLSSMIYGYVPGYWAAIVLNSLGYGLTHLLFLGKIERFWRALLNLKTSWISRGFLFNALFSVFGLLYAIVETLPAAMPGGTEGLLRIGAVVSAVLFSAYPGFMLRTVKAIPFWRSMFEPALFFLQGILGGVALEVLMLRPMPFQGVEPGSLLKLNLVLSQLILLLYLCGLVIKAIHGGAGKVSVTFLTKGEFSLLFLGGAIVAGLVLPLLILIGGVLLGFDFGQYRVLYEAAMLMELSGIYIGKYSILRAGAYSPLSPSVTRKSEMDPLLRAGRGGPLH